MEKGAEKILAKHGCLYMKDDYKALFEELEAYYKPTEVVKNINYDTVLCGVIDESEIDEATENQLPEMLNNPVQHAHMMSLRQMFFGIIADLKKLDEAAVSEASKCERCGKDKLIKIEHCVECEGDLHITE